MSFANRYQDIPSENAVIGAWLMYPSALRTLSLLKAQDFSSRENQTLYAAIKSMHDAGTPIDAVTVHARLSEVGLCTQETDEQLADCVSSCPSMATHEALVKALSRCSAYRKMRSGLRESMDRLEGDPGYKLEDARSAAHSLSLLDTGSAESGLIPLRESLVSAYSTIEMRAKGITNAISSGFKKLDKAIGGFFPGEVTVIAARPAVGKSAFALTLAMNAARAGKNTAVYSLEMSDELYAERTLSAMSGISGMRLRDGSIDASEWQKLSEAATCADAMPISICSRLRTVESILADAERIHERDRLDLIVIDYLQLMETKKQSSNRYETVSACSRAVKELAIRLNIPILLLAQVKRVDSRVAVMPILSDLRDSGSIEQDADNVVFLHRPETASDPSVSDKSLFSRCTEHGDTYICLNISKARQGVTGCIPLVFRPSVMRYIETP